MCNCNFPGKGEDSGQEDKKVCARPLHWNGLGKCVRVCVCVCVCGRAGVCVRQDGIYKLFEKIHHISNSAPWLHE